MELEKYVKERVRLVERAFAEFFPNAAERPSKLNEAAEYAVASGGKRLRPVFCLASAEAAGGRSEDALAAACAIEALHSYTLVHDDLPCMDNDTLRRGKPTVWKRYGETVAVLAGDVLQARAFGVLCHAPVAVQTKLFAELAYAADGVVRGQMEDLQNPAIPDLETLRYVFQHKTGDLFRCACRMGVICAGAGEEALQAIDAFAEHLGVAFQIEDDLLDAGSGEATAGASCLDVMSENEARRWCAEETEAALAALASKALPKVPEQMRQLALKLVARKI